MNEHGWTSTLQCPTSAPDSHPTSPSALLAQHPPPSPRQRDPLLHPSHIPVPNYYTPPLSPPQDSLHPSHPVPPSNSNPLHPPLTDDHFPAIVEVPIDLPLDDEGLSTLEKIYLYSRSKAPFHRVFIAHALPQYLSHVTPQDAVAYVLPLLSGLAMDDDELVKEAFAAELVPVVWWFFSHCQIIPDDPHPEEAYASSSTTVTISVQAFTPILGTLLLSSNPLVGGAARFAVVDLLSRMKKADDRELGAFHDQSTRHSPGDVIHPWEIAQTIRYDGENDDTLIVVGLFGHHERSMFTQEILQQVVIGMGRLDVDYYESDETEQEVPHQGTQPGPDGDSNPYFPPISSGYPQDPRPEYASWYSAAASPETGFAPPNLLQSPSISPGTEFPPNVEILLSTSRSGVTLHERHSSGVGAAEAILSPEPAQATGTIRSPTDVDYNWEDMDYDAEEGEDEQAAVGRLSSMSLMAAVTASGTLEVETQRAFVKEVERVGRDPVYWVRREASFALGALAKVVPEELVISSLLPLFDALRLDTVWHVRHSVLFALPAILSRLSPSQRRRVALETITVLSKDQSSTVRSGVLEALGEVIYTFHQDSEGPPGELVSLFLGRREDQRVRNGQQESTMPQTPQDMFYDDPKRHLICAFNFPAVAVTLGARGWKDLREVYLAIASDPSSGVRRTLAASLGELAKIIGPENAKQDLVDVWWRYVKSEEEEVRTKAIESLAYLIAVVGKETGMVFVQGLLTLWGDNVFRGWRERELIVKNLVSWTTLMGLDSPSLSRDLLMKGLEDNVAAVRETSISVVPGLWRFASQKKEVAQELELGIQKLATSSNYRRRMTFIACRQTLALAVDENDQPVISCDNDFLRPTADLSNDAIVGVRIGVARFAALVYGNFLHHSRTVPSVLRELVRRLSQDSSHDVQSYVAELITTGDLEHVSGSSSVKSMRSRRRQAQNAIYSRPPPTSIMPHSSGTSASVLAAQQHTSYFDIRPHLARRSSSGSSGGNSGGSSGSQNSSLGQYESSVLLSSPRSPQSPGLGGHPDINMPSHVGSSHHFAGPPLPDIEERCALEFQGGTTSGNANETVTVPG